MRDAPEDNKIAVFRRGTPQGCIGVIPEGGQVTPISGVGDKALWKKAQKKEKKNIISDKIKSMKPIFIPRTTFVVCIPKNVASRITSRHHRIIIKAVIVNPKAATKIESF